MTEPAKKKAAPAKKAPAKKKAPEKVAEVTKEEAEAARDEALREFEAQVEEAQPETEPEVAEEKPHRAGEDLFEALAKLDPNFDPERPALSRYQWRRLGDGSVTNVDWAHK